MLADWQAVRVMCGDAAEPWIDGERHLDDFIERGLVVQGAKGAAVFAAVDRLQRTAGLHHAAAGRAQHAPAELEQPEPRRMEETADHLLLAQAMGGGLFPESHPP